MVAVISGVGIKREHTVTIFAFNRIVLPHIHPDFWMTQGTPTPITGDTALGHDCHRI